jgi:hypothetical protein
MQIISKHMKLHIDFFTKSPRSKKKKTKKRRKKDKTSSNSKPTATYIVIHALCT